MHNHTIRIIRGSQSQKLIGVLGTDTVPIDPPIPVPSPEGYVYSVGLNMITKEQMSSLVNFLASERNLPVQKIKSILSQYGLGLPTKDCVMRHVSQRQIDLLREQFKQNSPIVSHGEIKTDALTESFWLSIMIVTFFLGDEWRTKNITQNLFTNERRMGYLRTRLETDQERYDHQFRFTLFADALFQLQDCEGFNSKIKELQQITPENPEVKLEDIAIEFQIANMLVKSGHGVKFRPRTGKKGQDFDIEINFKKTTNTFAEIKCKRDETPVSVTGLVDVLYKAEKQLPDTNSTIIFVRIPTDWLKNDNLIQEIGKIMQNFFQDVRHINAVVFIWEDWLDLPDSRKVSTIQFKLNLHPSPQYPLEDLNDLFLPAQILPPTRGSYLELSFGRFSD